MKQNLRYRLLLFFLSILVTSYGLKAQTSVFDPNDPVNKYDPNNPPVKPPNGQVGKWVRTVRVTWNTTDFKCYIYNGLPFRLKYPKNWDPTQKYPLLIFFHGRGEFGPTIYDNEYQLALGAQKHEGAVDDGSLINCFLLYPQVQQDYWASSNLSTVDQLVEKILIPQLKIDQFRIFVNGLSAGAGGVWDFMLRYTKLVAAATPISNASLAYIDSVDKYKFTPIYHFQGGLDTDPMPSTSRTLGGNILAAGGNYKYKEFPNLGHSCWNQAWAEPDYFPFYSKAHKANPWPLGGKTEFCKGDPINVVIGVTPGFDGYEWRKNGVLIGASTNQIVATDFGSYDCRVKSGTEWSVWSPVPVVIKLKAPTTQPQIKVTGMASNVIPAPDGSTSVPLEVPANYNSYSWQKEGNSTVLSTTPTLIANAAGDYKIHVTEDGGCPLSNYTTTSSFASIKIEAENYTGMYGVRTQTTGDAGGGLNVTYIDLDDWMDYNVNVTLAGVYNITLRVATIYSGGQFQVKDARGTILGSADIPNTTRSQTYVDVTVPINLASGAQTIRIQSSASPRWNFNYFTITGSNLLPANFSKPFKVVNANGTNGPAAISNLTAVTASMSSVELKWDQVASPAYNETAFEVYQAANNINGPYKLVVVTNADATGAVVNNLDQGVTYYYKVRAINDNAASTVSAAVSATTTADNTPPTAPASLHVGTITKSSVQLLWTASSDNVGVVRYDVYINGVKAYAAPVGTSYVVYNLLPSTSYNFSLKARDLAGNNSSFSNQVSATTLTGTVKIDPNQTPTSPDNHSVYLNFNLTNGAALPWNNMSTLPNAGITKKNMKNYSGDFSGISMTIVDNFSGYNGDGMITGNNSGVYPDNVMRSSYYCDKGVTAKIRIDGLSLMHKYSFVFFGSRNGGGDRTAIYSIGNQSVSLNASYNISQTVEIDNIIPDINGSVEIEITLGSVAQFAYLNSLVIKGYSSSVSDSTDTPPPPPPPPPPPAAGVVKVNVYGGVSPFGNSEWNNWNVSGSSNITSSSFKYSDGTSSLVSAELSSNRGINDNGTT
ncbi:MAG: carbohydrate-binding protein, partial [Flavisolibacter sp.]